MGVEQIPIPKSSRRPRRFRERFRRLIGMLGSAAVLSTVFIGTDVAVTSSTASAAPGDPFPAEEPAIFISQGAPDTTLYRATLDGLTLDWNFEAEGVATNVEYNGIGWNENDGYIYGFVVNDGVYPEGTIVRVGQEGVVEPAGIQASPDYSAWAGAFNEDNGLLYAINPAGTRMTSFNLETGASEEIALTGVPGNFSIYDFVYSDGYFWALEGGQIVRINPNTGSANAFNVPFEFGSGTVGAAWRFGNGNLGFGENAGVMHQVAVTNPGAAQPTFELISSQSTPNHNRNDGTSIPGLPADLSMEKTGDDTFVEGEEFEYQLTIRNNGAGVSSGWTVTDDLPEGVTLVDVDGPVQWDDSVTDRVLLNGGRLGVGEERIVTLTVLAEEVGTECITNVATVLGNEEDPTAENNTDTTETCPVSPGLTLEKTSDATEDTVVGDTVEYTVTATNNTEVDFTEADPAVVFDDLSAVLDDAVYNDDAVASVEGELGYSEPLLSWVGPLPAGESVELSYTVTLQGGGDGEVRNVSWQPSDPDNPEPPVCDPRDDEGLDPETGEPCAVTQHELPKLSIDKSADRTDLPAIDENVTYTVTVTNEGPGDYTADSPATMSDDLTEVLDDATLDETSLTATTGDVTFENGVLNWSGVLAAGESADISYTVSYTGAGDNQLVNLACVPEEQLVEDGEPCATVTIPGSDLESWKSVEASDDPAVAGSELTYTLYFENTGATAATVDSVDLLTHVLDDAEITTEPEAETGLEAVRDGEVIEITGEVPAGQTLTVSYTVTVLPDGERGDDQAANFLLENTPEGEAPPEPPQDPTCEPTNEQRPDCTNTPIGGLTYTKSVEAADDPLTAGSELTYTIVIDNIGQTAMTVAREDVLDDVLDDTTLLDGPVSDTNSVEVTEVDENNRFEISGEVAAGDRATVTYTVTVNEEQDRGNNSADNFLVEPGEEPSTTCEEGSTECTVTPLPLIEAVKDVDPSSGTTVEAGEELTYTLSFTNSGEAAGAVNYTDYLDGVLDDATLLTQPTASEDSLNVSPVVDGQFEVSGTLAAGTEATVTYTVEVAADGERGDNVLSNFLMENGEEPPSDCEAEAPNCTSNPVPQVESWKTVEADSTPVIAGTVLTYTLHFENSGAASGVVDIVDDLTHVVDDATVDEDSITTNEPLTVSEFIDNQLFISGELEAGETTTVTYEVTVNPDGERGDDIAANFLLENTPEGEDPPVPGEDPVCQPTDGERPDCTATPIGHLLVSKAVEASTNPVVAGTELTYTLTFNNQGQGPVEVDHTDLLEDVLDDTTMTSAPASENGELEVSDVVDDQFTVTGEIAAGTETTVQYTVTVNDEEDRGNNSADNFLVPTGEEPPTTCDDGLCTVTPLPNLTVDKSVDPASGTTVVAGEELTYTLTFTNEGQAEAEVNYTDHLENVLDDATLITDPVVSDEALQVSAVEQDRFTITGDLAAGQSETVTYTVEVGADGERGDNVLGNFLVETGQEPSNECDGVNCTINPVPHIVDWKTVDPASNTPVVAGQELTYTLHFENIGAATGSVDKVDDLTHVLDDAQLVSEPVASNDAWTVTRDGERIEFTGEVAAGETETIQYTVSVLAEEERGDDILANFLLEPGADTPSDPTCEPTDEERPDCTTNPVGNIVPNKSVDPEPGTEVQAGQELTYTLSFENTGSGAADIDYIDHMGDLLDDAELVGEIEATEGILVAGPADNQLLISGSVEPGETATVSYTVVVNAFEDRGNHQLGNFLTLADEDPSSECIEDNPLCTFNPTPSDPSQPDDPTDPRPEDEDDLAITGASGIWTMILVALALLGGGLALYVFTKKRRSS